MRFRKGETGQITTDNIQLIKRSYASAVGGKIPPWVYLAEYLLDRLFKVDVEVALSGTIYLAVKRHLNKQWHHYRFRYSNHPPSGARFKWYGLDDIEITEDWRVAKAIMNKHLYGDPKEKT